jgi:hypothetical protein
VAEEPRRYRFGPREPGTAPGGLGWGQLLALGAGLLAGVLALRAAPGAGGAALAGLLVAAGAAVGFLPVAGRPLGAWAGVSVGYGWRALLGRRRYRLGAPTAGRALAEPAAPELPPALAGARIVAVEAHGGALGALRDGPHWTGVLAVEPTSFALLERAEQERRVAAWGQALALAGRAGGAVRRLQWLERTAAQPVDELGRYLKDGLALPPDHRSVASYVALVDEAAPAARAHELLLAVQVDPTRAARAVRRLGGGEAGAGALLLSELTALAGQLAQAELRVMGALTPRLLARAVRLGYDPEARLALERRGARDPEAAGSDPAHPGPLAAEEEWGAYRTDSAWHATYWIAEWPRVDVGCDFLLPLLLGSGAQRALSVVMEPLDPRRALRAAEAARTNQAADEELQARAGFTPTARRRRRAEAVFAREQEVADGHAALRFSGYVSVSAPTAEALEAACAGVEQAAGLARLELRRLWGEQAEALTYTLPVCRGLR